MPRLIEPGTTIFIDANILLYAVSSHWKFGISAKCLLDSINDGKYNGITSVLVCNEVFHKSLFYLPMIDATFLSRSWILMGLVQ